MKGNILLGGGAKINKALRGFAAPIQLVVILTVVFAGLMVLLGTWSGSTPIYYQNMPESKFGDLLMSYDHVKENVEQTIDMDSEKMFANMGDYPIKWQDVEGKTLGDADWEKLYFDRFSQSSGRYFSSVNNLGFEWITIDFKGSSMAYCTGESSGSAFCKSKGIPATPEKPLLVWNFVYRVALQNILPNEGVVNKINSTETKSKIYESFINLNYAKDCAGAFFVKAQGDEEKIIFGEESEYFVREAINQKLSSIAQAAVQDASGPCKNFELSAELFTEDLCDSDECNGGKMKPVSYILFIKGGDEGSGKQEGAISFMNDFTNFASSSSATQASLEKCTSGQECSTDGEYCVKGVCGKCYAGLDGEDCSPSGSAALLGAYKCYKAISQAGDILYKCLEKKESVYLTDQGSRIINGKTANINCGLKTDPLVLEGVDSASVPMVTLNGVKIPVSSGADGRKTIGLCDADNVPQASGSLEIYLKSGNDEYRAYGVNVVYALDTCISDISAKLDGFAYSFVEHESGKTEVSFADLREDISKAIMDKIGNNPCEGYEISVVDTPFSCKASCIGTDTTNWAKERYSVVTLEIKENKKTGSGQAVAAPRYIISYIP